MTSTQQPQPSDAAATDPAEQPAAEGLEEVSRLLLVDGHSMAFRAFYAVPEGSFVTTAGQHTNAVHGFTAMLLTMIRQLRPTHVAVAFDLSGPTFRSEEYPEYKAGRQKTPEEFAGQIEYIQQTLDTLNIPWITVEGFEADDIVATGAHLAESAGAEVVVVSGDRDAFQLISERTSVLYPTKGISEIPPRTAADIEEKYGVPPRLYRHVAALVGESADNLPGVPKVGPKTAAKWLGQYGDLDGVLAHAEEIRGKAGENLRAHLEDVRRNFRLNELRRDLDLPVSFAQMARREPDLERMDALFDELEFRTLRDRVRRDLSAAEPEPQIQIPQRQDLPDAAAIEAAFGQPGTTIALTLQEDYRLGPVLQIADPEAVGTAVLEELDEAASTTLQRLLTERAADLLVSDLKGLVRRLGELGYRLADAGRDVALEAFVLRPGARGYDPEQLGGEFTSYSFGPKLKKPTQATLRKETPEQRRQKAVPWLDRFAAAAWLLHDVARTVQQRLGEHPWAQRILTELEIPLAEILLRMELAGVAVEPARLEALIEAYQAEIDTAQRNAEQVLGGQTVNLSSPKQLQTVLFETLGLPTTRKISSGYTTDATSLQELSRTLEPGTAGYDFMAWLLRYREYTKLRQAVEGLRDALSAQDRVHTTFGQTTAATGRLSSINPNLQNIPVRTAEGRKIRAAFVVGEGYQELLTADYSQIEMRIMAHLSQDEGLIQAYRDGEDLHRFVGSQVFGVTPADVTPEMRAKVKAMSYGLAYGLSSYGLSKQLEISVDEARGLMSSYFRRFGAVRTYLRHIVDEARKSGYTETMFGRRRYLPELTSSNRQTRDMAERAALNAPIQGSAADIIKKAMLGVDRRLREEGLSTRMVLQVHDELILEVAPGEHDASEAILREEMSGAAELRVPLEVQVGRGPSWNDAAH
ncbi:DNA polymerase I [Rothia kristinae]|uniref:DNA polymerase I n=1 Tax=Rothia kristinae TaxID=37923 RepID=UPI0021A4D94A|nr:DNA polymerase I [Rothia kristinae]